MLNRHEKFAIFNLSLVTIGILLFILIWQLKGITPAHAGFAVFGLMGFGHLIFLRKRNSSDIVEDERDRSIKLISCSGGYRLALMFFMLTSLTIYFTHSETGIISVEYFPIFTWIGWATYVIVSSIITLVQYRKGTNCGTC